MSGTTSSVTPVDNVAIPTRLEDPEFRFIKVRARGKAAVEQGWTFDKQYSNTHWELHMHLSHGGNYGVLPGYGGLCCFDADNLARLEEKGLLELVKGTFEVSTDQGRHYYFRCTGPTGKHELYDPTDGEHLGEVYFSGNFYTVGPQSWHPSGARYLVVNDAPIVDVDGEEILKLLSPFEKEKTKRAAFRKKTALSAQISISDRLGLSVTDYLTPVDASVQGDELRGAHPIHGSDNGNNLAVKPGDNTWYCHRCKSGGGALEAFAVSRGIISCHDAGSGCLTGELWTATLEALKSEGFDVALPAPVPLQIVATTDELPPIPMAHVHKLNSNLESGHFIHDYMDYWGTRTDAYPEFHHMGGVTLLSIAIDRKIHMPLTFADVHTNIWAMALGQSSVSRKTTALSKVSMMAGATHYEKALPGSFSTEGLFEKLSDLSHGYLVKDECASILHGINKKAYLADLRDLLSELYECQTIRRSLRTGKRKEKTEFVIEDPYVSFAWATTPESFEESVTPLDMKSGFLARFLYYAPRYSKSTMGVSVATGEMRDNLNVLGSRYSMIIKAVSNFHEISMVPGETSLVEFNAWNLKKQNELMNKYTLEGTVLSRLSTNVFKLAAVYYVGSNQFLRDIDDHVKSVRPYDAPKKPEGQADLITARFEIPHAYFMEALNNVRDYFLPVVVDIVSDLDAKASNNIQKKILQHVKDQGGRITRTLLLRKMNIAAKLLDEHLDTLVEADSVGIVAQTVPGAVRETHFITLKVVADE